MRWVKKTKVKRQSLNHKKLKDMKLIPVLTEKSLEQAKAGSYTFWVDSGLTKREIKEAIEKVFKVNVTGVKTINYKSRRERDFRGKIKQILSRRKAIVRLQEKEKIDLFEVEKKGKKK